MFKIAHPQDVSTLSARPPALNPLPTLRKNYLHPAFDADLIEMMLPEIPNAHN
jgi:hypothetical protein